MEICCLGLDTHHSLWYNTHMTNNDLDHLCKMLQESHDTACKVTGMDDTMFLQALEAIVYLRKQINPVEARVAVLEKQVKEIDAAMKQAEASNHRARSDASVALYMANKQ